MKKEREILEKIKEAALKIDPSSEVILFGSRARGDERKDSDWDILILVPGKADLKTEQRFRHSLFFLELKYGIAISTLVLSKDDWESKYHVTPLFHNIKKEGIRV